MPSATILIVDDEPQNRKLLEALLQPEGYVTRSAANGEEALASVAEHAPDLVLLDVMMPGMDGYQVASALKAAPATSSIPIIMVTAQVDRGARLAGLNAGAEEFLTKPVDRAELWLRVRNLLRLKAFNDLLRDQGVILEAQVQARTADLQRFRTAMDATADAILIVNRSTMRFVDFNASASALLGYTRGELLLLGPGQLGSASIETVKNLFDILIAGAGGSELAEIQMRSKSGALLNVEARRQAHRSGDDWVVVTVLRDIAERHKAAQELRESERRFSDLLKNVQLASVMLDCEARITYCNEYLLRLTGWPLEEIIGRNWFELFIPSQHVDAKDFFIRLLANLPETWLRENEILTRSGARRHMRWNNSVLRSIGGEVIGTASIGEDITARKQGEARIAHLNRVYAVLSGINTLIVRVHDRDELFTEACRIAVGQGGFPMAWIGIVDPVKMTVVPVASEGVDEEFLSAMNDRFTLDPETPQRESMPAQAVRKKKTMISNDLQSNPRFVLRGKHVESGIRSMAVLPLIVGGEAVGVLVLYATQVEFFYEEELKLLTELAGDISFAIDHIDKQERLDYLAYYDVLTGLANRKLFLERVAQYARSAAAAGHKLALYLIDLERFKNINDTLGQLAGDALLRQVAKWLTANVGDVNLLARVGADHFAVVLPEVKDEDEVAGLIGRTMEVLMEQTFHIDDGTFRIAAKAGIALFPESGGDAETLFKNAEAALKKAKARGDRCLVYTQTMTDTVAGKLTLENQLRRALDRGEFVLHYQPKVNLLSGKLAAAEALIRWNDPLTGLVPPGRFIPVLEETGLIHEVGSWALHQAIDDYLRWHSAGHAAVRVAVNVSPLQLRNRAFIGEVTQAVGIDARAATGLELEITESLIMEDVKHSIASLTAIRAMGITIAIDDFGTGFSSLSYLSKLPVDTLKIDRSFVTDMTSGPEGLALVSTIIKLAHSLKLKVVAEGVESEEQSRLLRLLGCEEMQGYLFSKPVPADVFETKFLAALAALPGAAA